MTGKQGRMAILQPCDVKMTGEGIIYIIPVGCLMLLHIVPKGAAGEILLGADLTEQCWHGLWEQFRAIADMVGIGSFEATPAGVEELLARVGVGKT